MNFLIKAITCGEKNKTIYVANKRAGPNGIELYPSFVVVVFNLVIVSIAKNIIGMISAMTTSKFNLNTLDKTKYKTASIVNDEIETKRRFSPC